MSNLVLYDGVCALCDRSIQFILKRDHRDRFRFASLQSPLARRALARHGRDPSDLNTVYVLEAFGSPGERLHTKAHAALFILTALGGGWSVARLFQPLPASWLNAVYDYIAARRYRWFGRSDACLLPNPADRHKFLDEAEAGAAGPPT